MSDEVEPTRNRPGVTFTVCLLAVAYVASYGVMRWQDVVTHYAAFGLFRQGIFGPGENTMREFQPHSVEANHNHRDSGVGWLKNQIAEPAAVIYSPLCWIEAAIWTATDSQ